MMTATVKNSLESLFAILSANGINKLSTRFLFGGIAIFYDEIVFAQIQAEHFYLRGHHEYIHLFNKLGMHPLEFDGGYKNKRLKYYLVPDELWQDQPRLIEVTKMVISYAQKENLEKSHLRESRIKDLPNMNLSLERLLIRVGIYNVEIFRREGAFLAYFKLKQENSRLTKNILFILHSALAGFHVAVLTKSEREILNEAYENFILSLD